MSILYEFSPIAAIFPLMAEAELRELAEDIRAHGLREAIVLDPDGLILDGRNRYRACKLVGIEPTFTVFYGLAPILFM